MENLSRRFLGVGTGQFPRETIWKGCEGREAGAQQSRMAMTSNPRLKTDVKTLALGLALRDGLAAWR